MFNNPATHNNCERCTGGKFGNCVKGKCIHGSTAKSVVGALEAYFWKWKGVYKNIDTIICCSEFMKNKMDINPIFTGKTVTMHNFVEHMDRNKYRSQKNYCGKYVLYFGRLSEEKGVRTLIEAVKHLPDINFIFAGKGECADEIDKLANAVNVGFKTCDDLRGLITNAFFDRISFRMVRKLPVFSYGEPGTRCSCSWS